MVQLYIYGGVAFLAVLVVVLAFLQGKHTGKATEERDAAVAGVEHARRGHEIDENVHRLDPAERERLLNRRD